MTGNVLVFDFDGVIADTEPLFWRAWAALLEPHSIRLSWEDYCVYGRGIKDKDMLDALPQLAAHAPLRASLAQQLDRRRTMIRQWCAERSPVAEATVRLLHSLGGYRLGLVTSSERAGVEAILQAAGIRTCFEALVFAEDATRHKPHPEPYLLVQRLLGVEGGLAFEDSQAGIESATAAGLRAVPVDAPGHLPEIVARALAAQDQPQKSQGETPAVVSSAAPHIAID